MPLYLSTFSSRVTPRVQLSRRPRPLVRRAGPAGSIGGTVAAMIEAAGQRAPRLERHGENSRLLAGRIARSFPLQASEGGIPCMQLSET
jgi:hypothetical protein